MKMQFVSDDGKTGKVALGSKFGLWHARIVMQDADGMVYHLMEFRGRGKTVIAVNWHYPMDFGSHTDEANFWRVAIIMASAVGLAVKECDSFLHNHLCLEVVDES